MYKPTNTNNNAVAAMMLAEDNCYVYSEVKMEKYLNYV